MTASEHGKPGSWHVMQSMASLRGVLLVLALAGCTATPAVAPATASAGAPAALPDPAASAATLPLAVVENVYGTIAVRTAAGAQCFAQVQVKRGEFGDAPPSDLAPLRADGAGSARWTYTAPRLPAGTGRHVVRCVGDAAATVDATFDVTRPPLLPGELTVRVTTTTPPRVGSTPDPSLLALREAVVERVRTTLEQEWSRATRGLGRLRVVEGSEDVSVYVVAGEGTSVNRKSSVDGSIDIVIYVRGALEDKSPENAVATVLHELGHIWCCFGPDSDGKGHWKEKLRDPGLYGVDKYGLMTDPVTCVSFGAVLSCPNRFSDREMRELGFTSFPQPAPDPCVASWLDLKSEMNTITAALDALKPRIDGTRARIEALAAQIRSLEAQYPGGMPPSVYSQYQSLIAEHNRLVGELNVDVDRYNAQAERTRALAAQLNALPCEGS